MKPIHRSFIGALLTASLVAFPVAKANEMDNVPLLTANVQNDNKLIDEISQRLSVTKRGIHDVTIIKVVPNGSRKAVMLFGFTSQHWGKEQQWLAVGDIALHDCTWHITSWGGAPQNTSDPFSLGGSESQSHAPMYEGVINDPKISRIVVQTNDTEQIDMPIFMQGDKRYFFGFVNRNSLEIDAVEGVDGEGKVVYEFRMNHAKRLKSW